MMNMADMVAKGDYKNAAYMLLSPGVIAGGSATLATPLVAGIISAMGGGDDPKEAFYQWAESLNPIAGRFARHGLAGAAFGVNLTGSLEMNLPFPTSMSGNEILGAPYGVVSDVVQGVGKLAKGETAKGVEKILPAGFGNISKAGKR